MLARVLNAAIDEAQTMSGLSFGQQMERCRHRPRGVGAFWRRKSEPVSIPGTKRWVDLAFKAFASGVTVSHNALELSVPGLRVVYGPGHATLSPMLSLVAPQFASMGASIDLAMAGSPIQIGTNRALRLVAGSPLPAVSALDGRLEMKFANGTQVCQGRFTANLRGVTIYPDRGEVDVEWRLFGFDLARNPVVWWA